MDRPCCGTAIISCVTTMRPRTRCRTRCCGPGVGGTAGTNLEAWLYKLAYHACIDLLRQRRRQLFAPPPPSGHNPDYIGPELRAALSVLTPEERGLVFGRVMEGRSYEELSQIYGPSAAALRKRYERARKKLALALSESELDEQKEVVP